MLSIAKRASLCAATISLLAAAAFAQEPSSPSAGAMPNGSMTPNSGVPNGTMREGADAMQNSSAQSFVNHAAVIGQAEVVLGQLALQKSSDADVKTFAQHMVDDHTAANEKLKTIAANDNLKVPTKLDAEHEKLRTRLAAMQGKDFDRAYTKAMNEGHAKAIKLFQSAASSQSLPADLKTFASTTLPTLQQHKKMATSLDGEAA